MHETIDQEIRRTALAAAGIHGGMRLGIIGGGQLARMTAMAAYQLGCEVTVLERNNYSPAAILAANSIVGDWTSLEALTKLAGRVDVLTVENEFIDADLLGSLERFGARLLPTAQSMRLVQDKLVQKQTLVGAGIPVPRFQAVSSETALRETGEEFGWPVVLKARRNGYDGKGNFTVGTPAEVPAAWLALGGGEGLYAEEFCTFEKELAVIVVRSRGGESAVYPVADTVQRDHICHEVSVPANVPQSVQNKAARMALRAVECVGGTGTFGVEMFLLPGGKVIVNELAPRVHNSGHYTIEGTLCSQFENHVRAIFGLPLGSTALVAPAAAMVNLLGHAQAPAVAHGVDRALAVPGAHVHIYGKVMSSKGRKMGHVTALGANATEALERARTAASAISFGAPR
jgi:5-(carboxyamino)imidazole ribonucleotide synthase